MKTLKILDSLLDSYVGGGVFYFHTEELIVNEVGIKGTDLYICIASI